MYHSTFYWPKFTRWKISNLFSKYKLHSRALIWKQTAPFIMTLPRDSSAGVSSDQLRKLHQAANIDSQVQRLITVISKQKFYVKEKIAALLSSLHQSTQWQYSWGQKAWPQHHWTRTTCALSGLEWSCSNGLRRLFLCGWLHLSDRTRTTRLPPLPPPCSL